MEASALHAPAALNRARLSVSGPLLRLRSDEQLVALFRAGNEDAFQTIHDRYRVRMFAYCRQMLSASRGDAEDATQDVFLKAFRALRTDDRPVSLRAWLYRVAHNRCIDQIRRPQLAHEDIFDMARTPVADPHAETERREDLRRLVADIGRLPDAQRSALLMREMEGLTYLELAAALDVTVPAIKSLLVRARIGLVESIEARDTACADIRTDLVQSFDRGVRTSAVAKRHLRECDGCGEYRAQLRTVQHSLNSLSPGGGPLAAIAKLLGIGGTAGGAAAGGGVGVGAGGVSLVSGGVAAATACKVAAVVCSAVVITAGVGHEVQRAVTHSSSASAGASSPIVPTAVGSEAALARLRSLDHGTTAPRSDAKAKPTTSALRAKSISLVDAETFITPDSEVYGAQPVDAAATGGSIAPDEDAIDDLPADGAADGTSSHSAVSPATNSVTGSVTPVSGSGSSTSSNSGTPASSAGGSSGTSAGSGSTSAASSSGSSSTPTAQPASSTASAGPTSTPSTTPHG